MNQFYTQWDGRSVREPCVRLPAEAELEGIFPISMNGGTEMRQCLPGILKSTRAHIVCIGSKRFNLLKKNSLTDMNSEYYLMVS